MNEVMKNIFQLDIPLEGSPLREIHTYLIRGKDRNLLVDTAFNTKQCEEAICLQMAELGASPADTDIFITHMHVDHSGLIAKLKTTENKVFASEKDARLIQRFQSPRHWEWLTQNNCWCGVPESDALIPDQHIAFSMRPERPVELTIVAEGDLLSYGGYCFRVIDLAGHTPGQIGLWAEEQKVLFGGDHILERISPNISTWDLDHNYVAIFCENLLKVKALKPDYLFSAHGPVIPDLNGRIDQLLAHHGERLTMIENLVREEPEMVTAYDIAAKMKWSSGKMFADLPIRQKWFATSETLAHLLALAEAGRISVTWERNEGHFGKC